LVVNEIDINQRYKLHNLILLGIIVQKQKPVYGLVLMEMISKLRKYYLEGFTLQLAEQTIRFRALITNLLLDIGERGSALNFCGGGFYNCHCCEILGTYCAKSVRYLDLESQVRTFKLFNQAAREASELIDSHAQGLVDVKGIRGFSVFSFLPFFFIPRSVL
jgi:hypothetical protein